MRTDPRSPTLPVQQLIRQRAEAAPDAAAICWDGENVSAGELDRRAGRVAAALAGLVGPAGLAGRPVAVRVPAGPDRYAALLGVLRAGAVLLWSGAGATGERGRGILDAMRPAAVLTGDPPDELSRQHADRTGVPLLDVTNLPAATGPEPAVALDGWAYIAHTSGSTGRPKGVPQTHAALAQFSGWFAAEFGLGPGVRVAQWVAPDHDPALCETFATLVSGAALCPVPEPIRAHPGRLLGWLATQRIDVLQTVPSFAQQLLTESTERSQVPLTLRRLLLMGEAVPASLVEGFQAAAPGMALANLYGPTETVAATWYPIPPGHQGIVPIGKPIPGRDVLLVDDQDRACPVGEVGELVVGSRYVTPGYLGDQPDQPVPDDPAFRPVPGGGPGPWYRTGDLAVCRPDGVLEFRGRRDQQVKLQGHRLELAEVESMLLEHESILECAVLPVAGADGIVSRLTAYVVPREQPCPADWRAHLRQRFGELLLPVVFKTVPAALPRNETGKVDRRRLAEAAQQAAQPATSRDGRPEDAAR